MSVNCDEPIAYLKLTAIPPGKEAFEFVVEIGRPYFDGNCMWFCAVSMAPLRKSLGPIVGADSMQALCHSISLVMDLLRHFEEKGGKILQDGRSFQYDVYRLNGFRDE